MPDYYLPAGLFIMWFFKKTKNVEELKGKIMEKPAPFLATHIEVKQEKDIRVLLKPQNGFEQTSDFEQILNKFRKLKPIKEAQKK